MRWDIRIAAHFFVAAAFFAVCVMAVPDYLHLTGISSAACFWGGLLGAALFAVAGFRSALLGERYAASRGHHRRMIGLYGMVTCAVGFIGFAGAYFWPNTLRNAIENSTTQSAQEQEKTEHRPPSFRHIFDKDLPSSGGSFALDIDAKRSDNGETVVIPIRFIYDAYAQTKFLAVFVKRDYPDKNTYVFIAANLANILDKSKIVQIGIRIPGNTSESLSDNYIFSNVIYFYAEEDMSLADQSYVESIFKKIGVRIQIRGQAYYTLHWNDAVFQETKSVSAKGH